MSFRRFISKMTVFLAPLALVAASASLASAQSSAPAAASATPVVAYYASGVPAGGCSTGACSASASCGVPAGCCEVCAKDHCPPPLVHCTPEELCIKFKCVCPKPACDTCNLDPTGNYGFTPTCWRPWTGELNCPIIAPPVRTVPIMMPPSAHPEGVLPPVGPQASTIQQTQRK